MVFFVDVGTDLFGCKQNTRLEFVSSPTLSELIIAAEAHFDKEAQLRRPVGAPDVPFKAQTMQVYDDVLLRWVDLYSASQLTNGCQVWIFQPESLYHSELPGTIPTAKYAPESWLGSPARARAVVDAGIRDPAMSEKLRSVFYSLDVDRNRYIPYTTLRDYFLRYDIPWTSSVLGDYYTRTGNMTYSEWVEFASRYPHLIDSLYYRIRGLYPDRALYSSAVAAQADVAAARARREAELRSYHASYAAEKARLDAEYRARSAARDAEIARLQREIDESRHRRLMNELYYRPGSPRFGYL